MTISSQNRQAGPFVGNDTATAFPFAFKVFAASDLQVVRTNSAGVESTLVLNTDYTATINGNQDSNPGGTITLPAVLATGYKLTITSSITPLQATDLTNQGGFYPKVITNALDKLTILIQQILNGLGRSLKFPISDSGYNTMMPGKDQRKGRVLAFHETTGDPVQGPSIADVGTVGGNVAAINTVATNIADVNAVAGNAANINAVVGNAANINAVAGNSANINAAVANTANINAVVANTANINTVAGNMAAVQGAAAIAGDIANDTSSTKGAALVGFNSALSYVGNTVGGFLKSLLSSAGSSLIGWIQAGTGATQRTVRDKLREVVSVKDFGAVGDGVTDDTAAIQAAINYCTNLSNQKQTLYFPANNAGTAYKVTAPLVVTGRLNIVGDGQFSTVINAVGMSIGQFVIDFDCLASDVVYHSGISNISIISNNGAPTGVRLKNISYMLMKQVYLSGLYKGIYITGTSTFSNFFEEVTGYAIALYTVHWENFTGGGHYMFSGCTFIGSDGVYLAGTAYTDSLTFYNCNFEQCTTTDMYVAGSVRGLTISACRSEGLDGGTSFLISPAVGNSVSGVTVTGCFWSGDFGNANPISLGGNVQGFSITGNTVEYMGFQQFVFLNGAGEAGVISGNYCANSPKVVNTPRDGVAIFNNRNSSGSLPDYWGTATWGVQEGTFTMSDASGAGLTFTQNSGKYTKVGRVVSWQAVLQFPTTSNGAGAEIAGLPFAVSNSSSATRSGGRVDITDFVGAIYVMQGYSTSTRFAFFYNSGNLLTNANLSGKTLYLSGTYTV